jgi:DnaJ-class molecular chaperone with C-terminal Zn finger domain
VEPRDAYRILNVIPGADPDVVRAAYRVLARKLHPDTKAGLLDPVSEKRMADLNWAYAQVRDEAARQAYERERMAAPPPTAAEPRTHGTSPPDAEHDPTLTTLDFGRYAGWKLRDVARRDIDYLTWLRRHASGARFRPAIDRLVREQAAKQRSPGGRS